MFKKYKTSNSKFQNNFNYDVWNLGFKKLEFYLINMLLNLGMFFNAIPVPLTTAFNGSSAM